MISPKINRTLRLPPSEYIFEKHRKNLIVLHHTAGSSAVSTFKWWLQDPKRIGTAFIVGRDGTIFEVFNPASWAFHVALKAGDAPKHVRRSMERRTIGIEIANAGWVTKRGQEFYKFDSTSRKNMLRVEPFDVGRNWRGQRYFEPYTEKQIRATARLVNHLCAEYGIPRETPRMPTTFKSSLATAKGIITHANVRLDKTDVHPGFDWSYLEREAKLRAVL